jgi:hypothetical protein
MGKHHKWVWSVSLIGMAVKWVWFWVWFWVNFRMLFYQDETKYVS